MPSVPLPASGRRQIIPVYGAVLATLAILGAIGSSPAVDLPDVPTEPDNGTPDVRVLSFEDRVRYQRAIEAVYWEYRIWPTDNPAPKPALESMLSETRIRNRVENYLRKSEALGHFWSRPLTGAQLQAEMDRMVRSTRHPEMLRSLFIALDNDPTVVAECLARPLLADGLMRSWYSRDERFHGALREQAESAIATYGTHPKTMLDLGGEYTETEWRSFDGSSEPLASDPEPATCAGVGPAPEEWRSEVVHLAQAFGIETRPDDSVRASDLLERLPIGVMTPLVEKSGRLQVSSVLSRSANRFRVATVTWTQRTFDDWWEQTASKKADSSSLATPVTPPSGGYRLSEVREGDCDLDTWNEIESSPPVRASHTAVWTGAEMIVWGGYDGVSYLNDGARYDPATAAWTAIPLGIGEPSPRTNHSAVWTGTEMIVWGGYEGLHSSLNTGGRYNPTGGSWTATGAEGVVPMERNLHSAVWTGREMIIWGGTQFFSGLRNGGRYDPSTSTWSTMAGGASAPDGEYPHTAVWTGKEMIVWGGAYSTNKGGRYDPNTNTWTPTSMAVQARQGATAVWTGRHMLVWGSNPHDGAIAGARYDPITDTWTTISTDAHQPPSRQFPTSVWTGTEMIVWGGYRYVAGDPVGYNTGGSYDDSADAWDSTPVASATPSRRFLHTAVWTGREMIIWGGRFGSVSLAEYLGDGSAYCACSGGSVRTWYLDTDGDGYGADATGVPSCVHPPNYIEQGGDCDDRYADCTTDCVDADADGLPLCAPDCDDFNPNCLTDCTDVDADGFCVETDCDDGLANCTTDCSTDADHDGIYDCADSCIDVDHDGYGIPGPGGLDCFYLDCDDLNPFCTSDCTDVDADGYCITTDCDDEAATCTVNCSDLDQDLTADCKDNCPGIYNPSQTDADMDGWGEAIGCDCDDAAPEVYPGAPEINDGQDNQCPGFGGHGLVDEITGLLEIRSWWVVEMEVSWEAQPGATSYMVVRSPSMTFEADCLIEETTESRWRNTHELPSGEHVYYLVRAQTPHAGSWGVASNGAERTDICP